MDISESIKSGYISTSSLVKFAENDPDGRGLWGSKDEGNKYTNIVRDLVPEELLDVSGFYCWGWFPNVDTWRPLYVGQSHNLSRRLGEGLSWGRIAFWQKAHSNNIEKYFKQGPEQFPVKWDQYKISWKRYLVMANTTHIIWVATPSLAHIRLELIEAAIIKSWEPCGNKQNVNNKSKLEKLADQPKREIQAYCDIVQKGFESVIAQLKNKDV